MAAGKDTVLRRITVEYGHWYVYAYLTDASGKVLEEETFKQPFRLDRKDAAEEASDGWHNMYQWLLDTCVFPSARDGDKPPDLRDEET